VKHASGRLRLVALLSVAVASFVPVGSARAETAEARAAVMLRDKAAANGKVVDRIPSGSKLTMIEMSADGSWARVRTKAGKEGWVPVASIRVRGGRNTAEDEPAEEPRDDEALAKRRQVRPEAWVNRSKYHDDDNKMTVVVPKAELFGRPTSSGTVLGIVRRGEVVTFVRKSADKKWVQIDIGAGELAWVDARAVRSGSDMPRAGEEDEPPRGKPRREEPDEPPPTARRREEPREEPPPRGKQARREDEPPPTRRREEPSPEELRRQDRNRDDEPPPSARRREERREEEPPPQKRQVRREERREEEPREEPPPPRKKKKEVVARDDKPSRPSKPPHGNNYVDVRVRFGFSKNGQQYRTNGTTTTLLTNYEFNTTNLGVGAQLGYSRAIGKFRLHIDGKYLMAAAGAVEYVDKKGAVTRLGILDQNFGAGIAAGGYWDIAGGIDLRLRIGADIWVNQISPSLAPIQISQDITLGMAIGLEFAMPELVYFGGRPFGFRIKGGAIVPGKRLQQPNLLTAPNNSTMGGYFGASIAYGLLTNVKHGQLFLELGYDLGLHFTHFTGQCPPSISETNKVCRDDTVDDANASDVSHLGTVGLYFQY
jgi:uncharacterized protein YgiM (DUF1202 family)